MNKHLKTGSNHFCALVLEEFILKLKRRLRVKVFGGVVLCSFQQ